MTGDWLIASFELFGEPKLLPTAQSAVAAIAKGHISHDTPITIRSDNGDRQTVPAGQIDQFAALLPPREETAGDAAESAPPPAPIAAEETPIPSGPQVVAVPPVTGALAAAIANKHGKAPVSPPLPHLVDPIRDPPPRLPPKFVVAAGAVILLALLVTYCAPDSTQVDPAEREAATASEAAPSEVVVRPSASQTTEAIPEPSETAGTATTEAADRCAKASSGLDRLTCDAPDLKAADARLRTAWNQARRRASAAGQPIESLVQVRQRIGSCSTTACARQAYAIETDRLNRFAPAMAAPVPVVEYTPAAPMCTPRGATPRGNPGNWVSSNDYPSRALREEREGTVSFELSVSPNGRVTSCRVTGSSGHSDLDSSTCSMITRRARFNPAQNGSCQPVTGTYSSRVRWLVPAD